MVEHLQPVRRLTGPVKHPLSFVTRSVQLAQVKLHCVSPFAVTEESKLAVHSEPIASENRPTIPEAVHQVPHKGAQRVHSVYAARCRTSRNFHVHVWECRQLLHLATP